VAEIKLLPVSQNGAAIFELYFRFRFLPVCSYRDVIFHPPAKFLAVRRLTAEIWRHIDFSRWRPWNRKSTSGFRFSSGSPLKRWISICMSNFDEISQSTAKIKLPRVSKKGRPPYWNCASGFDFDLFIVIGKSFCTSLSNFVIIGLSASKLWRHIDFSRWRS